MRVVTDGNAAAGQVNHSLHAVAILIGEVGVLIRGRPGSGKTRLGLGLIDQAHLAGGFACLVADDRVVIHRVGRLLVAGPHPGIAGKVEIRGYAIKQVAYEPAAVIKLVIDLVDSAPERLPEKEALHTEIAGVVLPVLPLISCISPGEAMYRVGISLRQDCHF